MRLALLHSVRAASVAGAAVMLGLAAACADAPTALEPGAQPRRELIESAVYATGLTRAMPLAGPLQVSAVIGPLGGELKIKETGLYLAIPAGAVSQPTTFTVTALAGDIIAYEFQPHGLTFAVPIKFEQSIKGTPAEKADFKGTLEGAYFKEATQIDTTTGVALVNEFLPVTVDQKSGKLKMQLEHFSGYMVSMGRLEQELDH